MLGAIASEFKVDKSLEIGSVEDGTSYVSGCIQLDETSVEVAAYSYFVLDELPAEEVVESTISSRVVLFKRLERSKHVLRTANDVYLVHVHNNTVDFLFPEHYRDVQVEMHNTFEKNVVAMENISS